MDESNLDEIQYLTPSFISNDSGMMSFIKNELSDLNLKKQIDHNSKHTDQTKENDTIIIHRYINKGSTIDNLVSREDIPLYVNSSTKSNSIVDSKMKQNTLINKLTERGMMKNKRNINKDTKGQVSKNFAFTNFIPDDIFKIQNVENIDDKADDTVKMIEEDSFIDEYADNDLDEEVGKVNKVKDFQEKYLRRSITNDFIHTMENKIDKISIDKVFSSTCKPNKKVNSINSHLISLACYNLKNSFKK